MFCLTSTQREHVLTLLFYLYSVVEMITYCDPLSITLTFPATGIPTLLWSYLRLLILIDNQTKTASDECKELDFYMSFKNGICAALCFTAIFQIIHNIRKKSFRSLRKAVRSTFLFICGSSRQLRLEALVTRIAGRTIDSIFPLCCDKYISAAAY